MCDTMLQGKGKIINRPTRTRKEKYDKYFCYLPTKVAQDSAFPFKEGEEVLIVVDTVLQQVILRKLPHPEGIEKASS